MSSTTLFEQNNKIAEALLLHFERKRVVFWYDQAGQMRNEYEALQLDGVEKVEIENNEFGIKYRVLKQEPTQKFLLYAAYDQPANTENWLLDLLFSGGQFHADLASLRLQEVGLPLEYKFIAQHHTLFFENKERKAKLTKLIDKGDTLQQVQLKMMSVICGTDAAYDKVWFALFDEELKDKKTKYNLLNKCNLASFLWERAEAEWSYTTENKTVKDLLVSLFVGSYERAIYQQPNCITSEAKLFMNRWKENVNGRSIYMNWSKRLEEELGIKSKLAGVKSELLLDVDLFSIIDKKIIADILAYIIENKHPNHLLQEWINSRRTKLFIEEYKYIYQALSAASLLQEAVAGFVLKAEAAQTFFEAYANKWHVVDRLYRNYIYACQLAEHQDVLKSLSAYIERLYANTYLLQLSDNWQQQVDQMKRWDLGVDIIKQRDFYARWIKPYTVKDNRVYVIISDALRYESMAELKDRLIAADRFTAKLTPTLGVIPSYTQLGMAAMLPHRTLSFDKKDDTVFVDGCSSLGTMNRTKILQKAYTDSIAITAEEFLKMKASTDGRAFSKQYKVIYIYSNTIDKVGDDRTSEGNVFQATENEFNHIIKLTKHIVSMKGTNIIVTADHGYVYQNAKLEESDFTGFSPDGELYKSNRRFVIGKQLVDDVAVNKWNANQLSLDGDVEILTAKSINRMRVQGAGSRFVHGGSTLQEIVVPVLEVIKERNKIIEQVTVEVIGLPHVITGNILPVNFYQQKAVSEKVMPCTLRATFYTEAGVPISDVVTFLFDSSEESSQKRERKYTFTFTAEAATQNNREVVLKLEQQIEGASHYKEYRNYRIKMLIAFSGEFDF